jgi:predicted RND superfamily exporter protein
MIMPFDEDKQLGPEAKEQLDKSENEIENIIEQGKIESEKAEQSKRNVSLAADSKILSVEEERQKLTQLVEAMGIRQLSEEVDILKESVKAIATKTSETIDAVNKLTEVMQNGHLPEAAPASSGLDPAKIEQVGNLVETLSNAWNTIKGNSNPQAAAPLIDQDFINQKMKSAVLEDLETGENIRRFISTALKQKATKSVVNSALGDLGATQTNPGAVKHQYGPN